MARPKKTGLDYFPLNVHLNDRFHMLESTHGNDGFAWLIRFWQSAYQSDSGEVDLTNLTALIFRAENSRIIPEKQLAILTTCVELGLIRKTANGMYTSDGVQKRIKSIIGERIVDRNRKGYPNLEFSTGKLPENNRKTTGKLPEYVGIPAEIKRKFKYKREVGVYDTSMHQTKIENQEKKMKENFLPVFEGSDPADLETHYGAVLNVDRPRLGEIRQLDIKKCLIDAPGFRWWQAVGPDMPADVQARIIRDWFAEVSNGRVGCWEDFAHYHFRRDIVSDLHAVAEILICNVPVVEPVSLYLSIHDACKCPGGSLGDVGRLPQWDVLLARRSGK